MHPSENPGFNRIRNCRHGLMIYNHNDTHVGRSIELYGEFSEGEVDLFSQVVRPGDVVFDIGANIGAHTLWMAKAVGPSGAVVAIEPQRVIFQALCGNAAINSHMNVICHQVALGESPGSVLIPSVDYNAEANYGSMEISGHPIGERVERRTLDSFAFPFCKLLKIDVEGMEAEVLRGGREFIRKHRPFIYVENDRPEKSAELIRLLDSMGYAMVWHRPPLYNPDNFAGSSENVFPGIISLNMLCYPCGRPVNLTGFSPVDIPPT